MIRRSGERRFGGAAEEAAAATAATTATENSGRFQYFANADGGGGGDGGGRKLKRCSRGQRQRTDGRTDWRAGEEERDEEDPRDFSPSLWRTTTTATTAVRRRGGGQAGPANKCNIPRAAAPPSLPAVQKSGLTQVRGTRGGRNAG